MNRFRELRLQNGYSQKQLKDLYNAKYGRSYSTGAMSLIETGKRMPELGALLDFADFYGVSLDYLLGRDLAEDNPLKVQREYKKGRKWHISEFLRELIAGLNIHSVSPDAQPAGFINAAKEENTKKTEYQENLEMLKCLLQQSAVLAKRVEENKNTWYKY